MAEVNSQTVTITADEAKALYDYFRFQYVSSTTQPLVHALVRRIAEEVGAEKKVPFAWRVP